MAKKSLIYLRCVEHYNRTLDEIYEDDFEVEGDEGDVISHDDSEPLDS